MSTQQFIFKDQTQPDDTNGFAVIFFLLGAPHIYSFLRQRSRRKSTFWNTQKTAGLITMLAGAFALLSV